MHHVGWALLFTNYCHLLITFANNLYSWLDPTKCRIWSGSLILFLKVFDALLDFEKTQQMTKKSAKMLRRQKVKPCPALGLTTEVVPGTILKCESVIHWWCQNLTPCIQYLRCFEQNFITFEPYFQVWNTFLKDRYLLPCFTCIYEPVHEISNNVVCATSKASDQPAHTRSLIRAFASRLSILWLLSYWLNIIWSF